MTSLLERLPESSLWLMILLKMTALLAAAWMAHWLLLGRNPRWRVMLWRGVMAGLVVLPVLELAMPAVPVKVPSPAPRKAAVQATPTMAGDWFARRPARPVWPGSTGPLAPPVEPSLLERLQEHKGVLLAIGWALVAAILAARTLLLVAQVRRLVKRASPAPQRIITLLEQTAQRMQCSRHVGLRLTAALVSPFLTRVIRPVILLPERMTAPERVAELEGVLAHELAHVRGNDLVWLLLARGLSCVLWFHPLTWKMAGAHAQACEEVCDAVAARHVGGAPAYSGMLARVALELMADAPADGGVGMVQAASILRRVRRIKRGIEAAAPAKRWIAAALAIGGLTLLALGSLKVVYAEQGMGNRAATTQPAAAATSRSESAAEATLVESKATVKREDGKVWIAGTDTLSWPEGSENTTLRSFAAALQIAGNKTPFEKVMGVSGAAFRMQVHKDSLCPSSPHAFCGFNCFEPALAALGYEAIEYACKKDDGASVAKTRAAIVESIDRGWPVLFGSEETGLVVGYKDKGEVLLVVPAYPKKPGFVEYKGWPWGFFVIRPKGKALPPRAAAVDSLQRAVQLAGSEKFDAYTVGFPAYDQWIGSLEDGKAFAEDSAPKDRDGALLGNAFIYSCLIDARRCASRYLPTVQGQFGKDAAPHVAKAADLYGQITATLGAGWKNTRFPWQVAKDGPFTRQMQLAEAAVLKEVRDLERQAVGEIEAALKAEGIAVAAMATTTQSAKRIRTAVGATSVANPPAAEGLDKEPPPAPPLPRITREDGKVLINDVPHGAAGNSYARGLETLLRYLGHDADYETIMGDTGQAFVLQAEEGGPIQHGAVDVGWWPMASWTVKGRLEFLSSVVGRELADRPMDGSLCEKDPAEHYRRFYKDAIQSSIDRGVPVLADDVTCFVAAGYDEGDPPLLGDCAMSDKKQVSRIERYPWGLIVAGKPRAKMDRRQVDLEALAQAVALGRDQVWSEKQSADRRGRYTGQRSFQLWAECVRDTERPGETRWHSNMVLHLGVNRRSAMAWLRAATKRHPQEVAQHLNAAADIYADVVAQLPKTHPAIRGLATSEGRASLVQVIEYVAALEARATNEMAKALAAAGADVKPLADADLPKLPAEPQAAPDGPRYPTPAQARTLGTGSGKDAEWAVLEGEWSVDPAGRIVGRSSGDGYLYRVEPHADDVRVTATLQAVDGGEVTIWMCGSPTEVEHAGYTLAVSTAGAKLQRQGKDVQQVTTGRIQAGKDHVVTFERSGATVRGYLDGATLPFVEWTDPRPLRGTGHGTLGFYVYGGAISVRNVKVDTLPPQPVPAAAEPEQAARGPQVTLRGNACSEDSFAKAVQAAAKLLGREVDLQTLRALSTNAFAPNIRTCEPCRSWWDIQAQDTAIDLVARRIGLRVESLPAIDHSADPPMPKDTEANREWLRTYYRKPIVPAIRKALDAGKVVIAGNEWDFAFHSCPWFAWGVITDARDDGTIVGAALNGRRDNPMNYVMNAWVLSTADPTLSAHQADLDMLRLAVDRIRGNVQANRADECGTTEHYVFGLEAMDAWIAAMATIPGFCAECQARGSRGWSDALDNGRLMHGGAVFAASCLRNRLEDFPPAARPHLEAAAKQYDRIAELLRPAVTTGDAGHYKTFIGDLAKQKTHADKVLRPVRDALASAGDEMTKALAVEGVAVRPAKARAVRPASQPAASTNSAKGTPESVVKLQGLKQPKMWMTRPGCLISCAQYLKANASPAWIYGGTGYAFAINIRKDICPSGPTAWPSEECDARAVNVGLVVRTFGTDKRRPDFQAERKKVWEQTRAAVDAGQPCFGWEMNIADWYVITGYDGEGNYLFDDFGRAEGRKPWTKLGDSEIGVVAVQTVTAGKPANDRTVVREAIRFAIEHSRGKGSRADWHAGLAGYDTWISALTDEEALAKNKIIAFGMGYNAACWKETRNHAAAFLKEAKQRLDDRRLDPLFDEAIENYSTVAANLGSVAKLYPAHDKAGQAQVMDSERRGKAVEHLQAAKQTEAKGLATLAHIAEALDGVRTAERI